MFKRLKEKYIKNRKLYHTYRYFKYKLKFLRAHSAYGEDVFLNKVFFNINIGFFVDVGALHPINGSLTYNLYKKGWNGINIDMSKALFVLSYNNPADINWSKIRYLIDNPIDGIFEANASEALQNYAWPIGIIKNGNNYQ